MLQKADEDLMQLGLFDIQQIDPTDTNGHAAVYQRRLADLALADELGLEMAFTAERHFLPTYRAPAPGPWLGAASQRTRRIRLGVLAYTLPIRPPVALAEEVAVLDHLTGGRLDVGLGLGHRPQELVALGIDPNQRITIFQERLAIMQGLWSGGQITIESDRHTLRDVAIHPLPLQQPYPPLWFAGTQPGGTSWAGANGLNLAVGFAPLRDLVGATAAFKGGRQALERSVAEGTALPTGGKIALMRHVYLAEDDQRARAEMIDDLMQLSSLAGAEGSRADRRQEAETELDNLLQKEVFLAGGPETVANKIGYAHRVLGIDVFLANLYAAHVGDDRIQRAIRLLADDVKRHLQTVADEPEKR
jgi:alkanesulfonate monooxygenase SsuD/methylene tetrahydromethanopterin reductase-like flavin-dependent oxidoreductase (luciferase family)